jgi:hypothetical protein
MLARCVLAAVLIAAHVPLPASRVVAEGHGAPMACCAPKSCCSVGHACTMGGACGGGRATGGVGVATNGPRPAGGDSGPWMIAGGCGDQTPRVTPVQLDPTVTAQVVGVMQAPSTLTAFLTPDARFMSLATRPLVPPPRA